MKGFVFLILLISQTLFAQRQIAYLSLPAPTSIDPGRTAPDFQEVPFELVNGMIFVRAQLNNQPGAFILDTGAPMLVLNRSQQSPTLPAHSCSGSFQVGESTVRQFGWAGMEKYELRALTTDLSHLEVATGRTITGLIGYHLLKNQELFIDYERQRLILLPPGQNSLHRVLTPIQSAPLTMQDHLPVIEFSIGNKVVRLGLDTGSETNLIDRCLAAGLDQALIDTIKEEELQGLDGSIRTVPVIQFAESFWKELSMDQLHYLLTDLCHLNDDRSSALGGLRGYHFLKPWKVSINYQQKKFYVWQFNSEM